MADALAAMDASEIADLVLAVTEQRIGLIRSFGQDPMAAREAIAAMPSLINKVEMLVLSMKREKAYRPANGVAVWLFTLRGLNNPHCRAPARAIWAELARGFLQAHHAVHALPREFRDITLDTCRPPDGLGPL